MPYTLTNCKSYDIIVRNGAFGIDLRKENHLIMDDGADCYPNTVKIS